ncbi:MAG: acyltransferase family protein [Acidobacteriaceae bacterium]|nr:acyltransferase family protein [Acidobacteriaceae bacterium]
MTGLALINANTGAASCVFLKVIASAVRSTPTVVAADRLAFIDNIRWTLIVLVICHHAAVTYSHLGSWYYMEGRQPPLGTTVLFATFETFNQAYFMGFLFLIAGYFVPRAFDAKGAARFLRDRAARLGIPSLFFMFVIHPVTVYWLLRNFYDPARPPLTRAYGPFLLSGKVWSASGPMWFAVALLFFCAVYAGVRLLHPQGPEQDFAAPASLPGHRHVIGLILLMGLCSFLVRTVQPIGTSILNMQLCYFSQYILLFSVGILAYRGNWLLRIPYAFGVFWMKLALTVGVAWWFALIATSGALRGDTQSLMGGLHWQSAAFCFWEAFFCLGVSLGLIVLFRDKWNTQGRVSRWMSRNSFTAYLFHTPLLIAVTLALRNFTAPPVVKCAVASALAVPITFILSGFVFRKIPGLRRVL